MIFSADPRLQPLIQLLGVHPPSEYRTLLTYNNSTLHIVHFEDYEQAGLAWAAVAEAGYPCNLARTLTEWSLMFVESESPQ